MEKNTNTTNVTTNNTEKKTVKHSTAKSILIPLGMFILFGLALLLWNEEPMFRSICILLTGVLALFASKGHVDLEECAEGNTAEEKAKSVANNIKGLRYIGFTCIAVGAFCIILILCLS